MSYQVQSLQLWCICRKMTKLLSVPQQVVIKPIPSLTGYTPNELFTALAKQPHSIFLDSSKELSIETFSILLWDPVLSVESHSQQTNMHLHKKFARVFPDTNPVSLGSNTSPFMMVKDLHQQLLTGLEIVAQDSPSLPFLIGFAGHFGYDLGAYIESFAPEKLGEYATADMGCHLYTHSLIYAHHTDTYYLCYLSNGANEEMVINDLIEMLHKAPNDGFTLAKEWQANLTEQEYCTKLDKIHEYILAGDCYQTNFAQRFDNKYSGNEYMYYQKLRQANKAPFSSYVATPQGAILSLSPERFIQVKDNIVETKPIKGTMPRDSNPVIDQQNATTLLASHKDQAENLMIVDLLRNDLSKHCIAGTIQVPKLFALESYPAVHHMVSTVTGKLAQKEDVYDLLEGAFPGGSITGAPKIRAMEIILELEPNGRNIYCGSIGYIGLRYDMDTNICIRTLLCENERIYCWAGGGIVLDSVGPNEYQETLDKISKIIPKKESIRT